MRVERQGDMECALVTIAALTELPLDDVRVEARDEARRQRKDFYKHSVLSAVARTIDPSGRLLDVLGFRGWAGDTGSVRRLSSRIRCLPAIGRGAVRFRFRSRSRRDVGHIMPWENGRLFNPETADTLPEGETLAAFRQKARHMMLDYVTVEDRP